MVDFHTAADADARALVVEFQRRDAPRRGLTIHGSTSGHEASRAGLRRRVRVAAAVEGLDRARLETRRVRGDAQALAALAAESAAPGRDEPPRAPRAARRPAEDGSRQRQSKRVRQGREGR